MATTPQTVYEEQIGPPSALQEKALKHLWMHFTRMGSYDSRHEVPIIVRGEGSYVYDEHDKRYLDGLSALFCVNAGHGRTEIGEAAARQVEKLGFFTNWSYAHPVAIELAERIAGLAPGDLNRVFFTSGGSEAVESAWKLARQFHKLNGDATKTKIISRETAYHGTTFGALSITGITPLRTPFEPLVPGAFHVPNTNSYRWPEGRDPLWAADQIEHMIEFQGPETVAAVILEPVQNSGGCFVPQDGYWQRVREICDRHGVLLIADEVICSWGRLGHYFGVDRFGVVPDMITTAKGITSAYAPMGAVIVSDRVAEPFMNDRRHVHPRHHVRRPPGLGGHGDGEPRHLRARGPLRPRARQGAGVPRHARQAARGPADRRRRARRRLLPRARAGQGQGDQGELQREEGEELLRGFMSGELYRHGLICRADDRGDPVIQLSPPLIADTEEFEVIDRVLRQVLTDAWDRVVRH